VANIDAACRAYPEVAAMVDGIHQEGPWISPMDGARGAHPLQHVRPPDVAEFDRLQKACGDRITMLTVAPEVPGATALIREVASRGVVMCLGHHAADREHIQRAVEAGARCVTHLGNGCQSTMPRHPNVIWEQAAEDRLYAGIIADGQHLPPATVKVLARAKPRDRLILVSDAVGMAGAPPGLYHDRGSIGELTPEGRWGFYGSPILKGAAVPLARCLANFATFVDQGQAPTNYLSHVTDVPGTLMGLPDVTSTLGTPGAPATFCVWRWEPEIPNLVPQRIVLCGRTVYDAESLPTRIPFGRTAKPATRAEGEEWLARQT
jgi:N-acetylglucosamine-6-phosphate deacetylase